MAKEHRYRTSKGNFIALCDADDIWHRDKLRIQSNIAKNTNAKFITCARKIIKDYNDYDVCSVFDRCSYKLINKSDFRYRNPIVTSSVLISTDLFRQNKFLEIRELVAVEDYDYGSDA